jgi:RNA polymerase sigma factor (sigma-70 family)
VTATGSLIEQGLGKLRRDRYDEAGWCAVYDGLVRRARAIAFRLLDGDAARTDDVVHDAFLRLLRGVDFERFATSEDFVRYFSAVVRHAAIDSIRAAPRELSLDEVVEAGNEDQPGWDLPVADMAPGPEALLMARQALDKLKGSLGRRDTQVCELLMQGYGPKEIAARMGLSDGTAAVAIHRLRARAKRAQDSSP